MKRRKTIKILGTLPFIPLAALTLTDVKGKTTDKGSAIIEIYNLVIYGGTPGGIACAVRAAREGLKVLLVNYNQHLGGQFANGLGTMDTLYNGARAPVYDELRYDIYGFYRSTYGYQSAQYEATKPGHPKTRFESHVVERLIDEMIERESGITVIKGYYPYSVELKNKFIASVSFKEMYGENIFTAGGSIFADCSYEGDLAAISGVNYKLGRESTDEYGEKNAGMCYYKKDYWPPTKNIIDQEDFKLVRRLNLASYKSWSDRMEESTGKAHEAIMAFNIRTTLTNDPDNRIIPDKPKNYDPEYLKNRFGDVSDTGLPVPNQKTSWNDPRLVGLPNKYVEGNWEERQKVINKFREVTLGLLYFKQNDSSVPAKEQSIWKQYGLPKNEYTDNGHMPHELYVREARRIVGRSVFTEHCAMLQEGLKRAPIQSDSISVTEWFMDSHFCTETQIEGSKMEGEVMLKNKTFPGQISLGTIFSEKLENLIVPVCLSSSHVGWGTIRLEPTWMSIGEVAGYIAAIAVSRNVAPTEIDSDSLIRRLARERIMISFFNDVEGREYSKWYPAIQYLGTKGFFGSYMALPNDKLTVILADEWLNHIKQWLLLRLIKMQDIKKIVIAEETNSDIFVIAKDFALNLGEAIGNPQKVSDLIMKLEIHNNSYITRGDACRLIFEATEGV
jgi:hypothetical protein